MHHTCPARALEGYRLLLDSFRNMKILGSWCDDCGGSSGAVLAGLQAGSSAFYKHEGLLRDKTLTIAGRAGAFGSTCTASEFHGSETLHLDSGGLRRLKGWEGRWLRSIRRFRRSKWETHQHFMKRTEDALVTIYKKNELKRTHMRVWCP